MNSASGHTDVNIFCH